jgi:MoaA/NifB/PqqE/SkfB family radical SAM enzyme
VISTYFIPETVVLELTYKCNHSCLFCSCPWEATAEGCSQYERGQELNFTEWKRVIDKLAAIGVKNISISGGEALLKDCLLQILEYIREKGVFNKESEIVLISNGLLMTDHLLREFKRHNVHLSMSLPGLETFEKHTGVDNASGVLHWFGEAKKLGVSTTVNVTVTALNYHELFETLANGVLAGADSVLINRFLAGGRGLSHLKELSLNKEQLNGMLDPAGFIRACNHSPRKVGHIFDEIASLVSIHSSFCINNWSLDQGRFRSS